MLEIELTELQVVEFKKGLQFRVLHVMEREGDALAKAFATGGIKGP